MNTTPTTTPTLIDLICAAKDAELEVKWAARQVELLRAQYRHSFRLYCAFSKLDHLILDIDTLRIADRKALAKVDEAWERLKEATQHLASWKVALASANANLELGRLAGVPLCPPIYKLRYKPSANQQFILSKKVGRMAKGLPVTYTSHISTNP